MRLPRVSSGVLGLSESNPKKIRSSLFHTHCSSFKTGRQAPPYLSPHQAQKERPAHPSPAPHRNALSRPIEGKNKTG